MSGSMTPAPDTRMERAWVYAEELAPDVAESAKRKLLALRESDPGDETARTKLVLDAFKDKLTHEEAVLIRRSLLRAEFDEWIEESMRQGPSRFWRLRELWAWMKWNRVSLRLRVLLCRLGRHVDAPVYETNIVGDHVPVGRKCIFCERELD